MSRSVIAILPSCMSFGMDEQDVVDQVEVLEQHGAHQAVEVAARHQAEFFCF